MYDGSVAAGFGEQLKTRSYFLRGSARAALIAAALLCAFSRAKASEMQFFPCCVDEPGLPMEVLSLNIKRWYSRGAGMFRKSFPFPFPTSPPIPPSDISMGSTLEFNGINTTLNLYSVEVRPAGWLSFEAEHGNDAFRSGTGLDHDWINSPGYDLYSPSGYVYYDPHDSDFSKSMSSLSGATEITALRAYLRVIAYHERIEDSVAYTHFVDVFGGYVWYDDKIQMRDAVQVDEPDPFLNAVYGLPPPGPYPGLDSSFTFHWEGAEIGLREKCILNSVLSSEGRFGVVPAARYVGRGSWNLRSDLLQNPSFRQTATGHAFDLSLDLTYSPVKFFAVKAGYMAYFFYAKDGVDTINFADGSTGQDHLDRAKSERRGLFASASLKF